MTKEILDKLELGMMKALNKKGEFNEHELAQAALGE